MACAIQTSVSGSLSSTKGSPSPAKETTVICAKMTEVELQEFIDKQKKILKNSSLLSKLEDKGEKVRRKLEAAEAEFKNRNGAQRLEEAMQMMDSMTLKNADPVDDRNSSGEPGISSHRQLSKYAEKITEKIEHTEKVALSKEKFQPNRSLKHEAEIKPEHAAKWETFPDLKAAPVTSKAPCLLSIEESIKVARENAAREKLAILTLAGLKLSAACTPKRDEDARVDMSHERFRTMRNDRTKVRSEADGFDSDDDSDPVPNPLSCNDDDNGDEDEETGIKVSIGGPLEELD